MPKKFIYDDVKFLAFLDIQPVSSGHTLIIPKEHIVWMHEADDEIISEIFKLSKKLMIAIRNATGCDYVQLSISGTDVPHLHVHLIPRYFNDGFSRFPTKKYKEGEEKEIIEKIIQAL